MLIPIVAVYALLLVGCKDPAVQKIESLGGTVMLDNRGGNQVIVVDLKFTPTTDADLVHIEGFSHIFELDLSGTAVTDDGLKHLVGLQSLRQLRLFEAKNITDAGLEHLKKLPNLEGLSLELTQVTDEGIEALKKELPHCEISYTSSFSKGEWIKEK